MKIKVVQSLSHLVIVGWGQTNSHYAARFLLITHALLTSASLSAGISGMHYYIQLNRVFKTVSDI